MSTPYEVADMMIGVRNMIEAADLRRGDQVLLARRYAQRQDHAGSADRGVALFRRANR